MSENPPPASLVALLTLREVRTYIARSHGRGLAVFIATAYALGSMMLGGMLILAQFPGGYSVLFLWGNALGLQPWNYPGVLIEAPWGFVILPFFATVSMILVSAGVGLGMAVAVLLSVHLLKARRSASGRPVAAGTVAGLTPAMIALVTLGACCSTTAAATAGVGLVAQASGSSTTNLLLNNWFLDVFQIVVVYIALIAQELLLRVYGNLFAANDPAFGRAPAVPPPAGRWTLATGALRAILVASGVTWVLTVFATWTVVDPTTASAALWFNWAVEHWLVGGTAVFVALSPAAARNLVGRMVPAGAGPFFRGFLLLGAYSLGGWVPPPLSSAGVEGFGNQLLGVVGFSTSSGAVTAVFSWGSALVFQWAFQYLLLALFAGALAVYPKRTLNWLAGPADAEVAVVPPDPDAHATASSVVMAR